MFGVKIFRSILTTRFSHSFKRSRSRGWGYATTKRIKKVIKKRETKARITVMDVIRVKHVL